jgi:peptide/nickel transport system ATP-binding protein
MEHPSHPYTRLLLESIPSPDPDERWEERSAPVDVLEQAIAEAEEPSAVSR